jgi:predicted nucleic acid-binding protein
MAILIDTSVFVAAERGNLQLGDVLHADQEYALSVVTAAELLHGLNRATPRRIQARSAFVEGIVGAFAVLPVDLRVARAYAHASAALARTGMAVDANDLWIGASALANGLEVLALDGDFDRIPGLRVRRPG